MGAPVKCSPAMSCGGREFSGQELEGDDAKRVIIFECSGAPGEFSTRRRRGVIRRTPRRQPGLIDAACSLEIDESHCSAMNKNVRRLAIAPDPAGGVHPGKHRLQLIENLLGPAPGRSCRLQSFCSEQRASRDFFEDQVAVPVFGELPKNLGDGQTCRAQFAQDPGLVLDERIAVSPVPVCFAMPPSFFDYHPAHRQNGKIDCLINASFPALSFRLEDEKFADEQAHAISNYSRGDF